MPAYRYFLGKVVEDGGGLEGEGDGGCFAPNSCRTFSISAASSSSEYSGMSLLKSAGNDDPFNSDGSIVENEFGSGSG